MKTTVSALALTLALGFTVPAFAGPGSLPTNKNDCEKAGKMWDAANNKCVEKQ